MDSKESNMRVWTVLSLILISGIAAAQAPKTEPTKTEAPKPVAVTLDGLTSVTPENWMTEKPANLKRSYQFKIPRTNGDKEDGAVFVLTTVHGTPRENVDMIKGWFILPTSMTKDQAVREWEIKNAKATLTCVDVQGTFRVKDKPVDETVKELRPDYRMVAAVWVSKEASYSIRMVGPKKTLAGHVKEFEQWLRNFK
jgi:hypothetical protein